MLNIMEITNRKVIVPLSGKGKRPLPREKYSKLPLVINTIKKQGAEPSVVVHICNPSTQEAESGGSQV
jgi:hypothetical protein